MRALEALGIHSLVMRRKYVLWRYSQEHTRGPFRRPHPLSVAPLSVAPMFYSVMLAFFCVAIACAVRFAAERRERLKQHARRCTVVRRAPPATTPAPALRERASYATEDPAAAGVQELRTPAAGLGASTRHAGHTPWLGCRPPSANGVLFSPTTPFPLPPASGAAAQSSASTSGALLPGAPTLPLPPPPRHAAQESDALALAQAAVCLITSPPAPSPRCARSRSRRRAAGRPSLSPSTRHRTPPPPLCTRGSSPHSLTQRRPPPRRPPPPAPAPSASLSAYPPSVAESAPDASRVAVL